MLPDCGLPPTTANSNVDLTDGNTFYMFGAVYTCDIGYEKVSGDFVHTCQHGGNWDGIPITCSIKGRRISWSVSVIHLIHSLSTSRVDLYH